MGKKQKKIENIPVQKYVKDSNRKSFPMDQKILRKVVSYMSRKEQMICLYMNKAFAEAVVPFLWEMIPLKKKSVEIAKILQIKITEGPLHTGEDIKENKKKKKKRIRKVNINGNSPIPEDDEKDNNNNIESPLPDKLPELQFEDSQYPPMFEYHTFVKILNGENMDIWDDTTMKVLERCGPNAEKILLLNVRFYNTALFAKTIALCCPNIKVINFQGTRDLGKLILDTFLNNCLYINSINLVNTSCKTGKSILDALKQVKSDKLLSLKFGLNVDLIETSIKGARFLNSTSSTGDGFVKANPDLVEVVDRRVSVLARQYPVDITNQLSNYMTNLTCLTIFSGQEISSTTLMQFANVCNKLEELTLGCINLNDETMELFLCNNKERIKKLEIIDFRDVVGLDAIQKKISTEDTSSKTETDKTDNDIQLHEEGITRKTFENISEYCSNLVEFSFDNRRKNFVYLDTKTKYDYTYSDIAECLKKLTKLKILKLSYNPLSDSEMSEIIKSCPNLYKLDCESCYWSIGKKSIPEFPSNLISLNCFIDKNVKSNEIRDMVKKMTCLNDLVLFVPFIPKPKPKVKKSKEKALLETFDDWISLLSYSIEGYDLKMNRSSHIFLEGVLRSEALYHFKYDNIQKIRENL